MSYYVSKYTRIFYSSWYHVATNWAKFGNKSIYACMYKYGICFSQSNYCCMTCFTRCTAKKHSRQLFKQYRHRCKIGRLHYTRVLWRHHSNPCDLRRSRRYHSSASKSFWYAPTSWVMSILQLSRISRRSMRMLASSLSSSFMAWGPMTVGVVEGGRWGGSQEDTFKHHPMILRLCSKKLRST